MKPALIKSRLKCFLRVIISNVEDLYALVIDDEPQVSKFVAEVLRTEGWNVSEAGTAEQAFEMLPEQKWSLVFCDVMLGGTNGYEVLRRFVEEQFQARIVLMTGHGSAVGALDATAFGAYDYLTKPFTVDDILNIAKVVCEQHWLRLKPDKSKSESSSSGYTSDIQLIGKSPKFIECLKMVGRVAATNLTSVLSRN